MFHSIYLLAILFSVAFNLLLYAFAYLLQTDKLTDISYTLTFVIINSVSFFYFDGQLLDAVLLGLVLIWAVRLGGYLLTRILKIGHDDRFTHIRINPWYFLGFWLMQGLTCAIVSFPIIAFHQLEQKEWNGIFLIGVSIAIMGLLLETLADYQKYQFKLQNPKQFMSIGLWKRVRHPNYTGELMFWWSVYLIAVSQGSNFLSIIGPIWLTLILVRFSGIPILERSWKKRYGEQKAFQEYWQRSYRLIPFLY